VRLFIEATRYRQRLAAILAADAAGYSRLMAQDEHTTITALDAARKTFRSAVDSHEGRVIDTAGDSVLAVFETAAGAVNAAIQIQADLGAQSDVEPRERRLLFRIGVHLGDVIEKPDGSVYGEGVNIAARLEGIATPGGIAVSEAVYSSVRNRVSASFEDLGARQMKNIADPVHAFRMCALEAQRSSDSGGLAPPPTGMRWSKEPSDSAISKRALSLPRWATALLLAAILVAALSYAWLKSSFPGPGISIGKSIAVLPFVDMSDKHDQEYFSDGLSEELIDQLANAGDLKVIARTSSFQFRGRNEDIRAIALKLGVSHVLEGSVRKSGDQLRITAQLIEAKGGTHLWSQTYDRSFLDIFKVQDEIARNVSRALRVTLNKDEARPASVRTHNLLLEGHYFESHTNKVDLEKAIRLYKEAIELEPHHAMAWVRLASAHSRMAEFFGSAPDVTEARAAVDQALRLDPRLGDAHAARAFLLKTFDWDWQGAAAGYRRANELSPDSHRYDAGLAGIGLLFGRVEESIAAKRLALERDPLSVAALHALGNDLYVGGRYEEAANAFRKVIELDPSFASVRTYLGTALLLQGQPQQALAVIEQEKDPSWKSSGLPLAYWSLGRRQEADDAMAALKRDFAPVASYQIAQAHAYRGETSAALDWLERAYGERDGGLQWTRVDPIFKRALRGEPRYQAFLVKLKLDGDGSFLR
jgi:TolB-like protein/class 3 adenylate cyclase/Flp pilus assembly protein TadD